MVTISNKLVEFKCLDNPVVTKVLKTYKELKESQQQILHPFSISVSEYYILNYLSTNKQYPVSVKEIGDNLFNPELNVSRLVDKLFIKDYITREHSDDDRRKVEINITEKGIKLLLEIHEHEQFVFNSKMPDYDPSNEDNVQLFTQKDVKLLNQLLTFTNKEVFC